MVKIYHCGPESKTSSIVKLVELFSIIILGGIGVSVGVGVGVGPGQEQLSMSYDIELIVAEVPTNELNIKQSEID